MSKKPDAAQTLLDSSLQKQRCSDQIHTIKSVHVYECQRIIKEWSTFCHNQAMALSLRKCAILARET